LELSAATLGFHTAELIHSHHTVLTEVFDHNGCEADERSCIQFECIFTSVEMAQTIRNCARWQPKFSRQILTALSISPNLNLTRSSLAQLSEFSP